MSLDSQYSLNSIKQQINLAVPQVKAISDSALLDVQLLIAFVLNKELSYLHTWPEKQLEDNQILQFKALLSRRVSGEPIAYILGVKEFWSLPFYVAPSTLIPRPDTEILVEQVLMAYESAENETIHCLDLGTGTGAIALALASEKKHWKIDAVDYSNDAVLLAQKNANNLGLSQVKIYQSDWFSQINKKKAFDVIVSNPPYIDDNDEHLTQGDVRFEPKSALVAENSGLADIRSIICTAKEYLKINGTLFIEHGYQQAKSVQDIFSSLGFQEIKTVQDYGENDRITWARLSN